MKCTFIKQTGGQLQYTQYDGEDSLSAYVTLNCKDLIKYKACVALAGAAAAVENPEYPVSGLCLLFWFIADHGHT